LSGGQARAEGSVFGGDPAHLFLLKNTRRYAAQGGDSVFISLPACSKWRFFCRETGGLAARQWNTQHTTRFNASRILPPETFP